MKICVTGTSVYGPRKGTSDIDVVMLREDADDFSDSLRSQGYDTKKRQNKDNEEYDGFMLMILNFPGIDIIVVEDDKEFNAWKTATDKMKKLEPIYDRNERISTFQRFRNEAMNEA